MGFSHNVSRCFHEAKRWHSSAETSRVGDMVWRCASPQDRAELCLACHPDAIPGPLQPGLCYQDLHSALLLDPKHPQAKALLQMMVDQARQARQDAGILAVQGKLQHALQCINCAIENNPLDPCLFLFRYCVARSPPWVLLYGLRRASWTSVSPSNPSLLPIRIKARERSHLLLPLEEGAASHLHSPGNPGPPGLLSIHTGRLGPTQWTRLGFVSMPCPQDFLCDLGPFNVLESRFSHINSGAKRLSQVQKGLHVEVGTHAPPS